MSFPTDNLKAGGQTAMFDGLMTALKEIIENGQFKYTLLYSLVHFNCGYYIHGHYSRAFVINSAMSYNTANCSMMKFIAYLCIQMYICMAM